MDQLKFVEVLKATLDPTQNKQADEHLTQVCGGRVLPGLSDRPRLRTYFLVRTL
jgi:hypothetical protein